MITNENSPSSTYIVSGSDVTIRGGKIYLAEGFSVSKSGGTRLVVASNDVFYAEDLSVKATGIMALDGHVHLDADIIPEISYRWYYKPRLSNRIFSNA